MDKINFIDNQEPALNATNLNQMQTNTEDGISELKTSIENTISELQTSLESKINGVIAYEDYSITSMGDQALTLSQELSDYTYYEVWASRFADGNGYVTTGKIPIGKASFIMSAEDVNYYRDIECPSSGTSMNSNATEGMEQRCIPRIIRLYK